MKFREMITDRGTMIFCGKSAPNNEELITQVRKNEEVFHTAAVGSGFVNIKGRAKKGDIKNAAIFCAAFQRLEKNKKDVIVHRFKGKDICKKAGMKIGTFGVDKIKKIKIKKEEIQRFLKEWEE